MNHLVKLVDYDREGAMVSLETSAPRGQRRLVNKAKRAAALLDAAHRLVAAGTGTDFTMQQLAAEAGLSLATTYNLIGTKAAVLYALLDGGLDELAARQRAIDGGHREGRLAANAEAAVLFFSAEESYYRPLMRYLLGVYEPEKRPLFMARAIAFWRIAVGDTNGDGRLPLPRRRDEVLARGLHVMFIGALDLWVHHEIDGAGFREIVIEQLQILTSSTGDLGTASTR